jgi:hypothetical protein
MADMNAFHNKIRPFHGHLSDDVDRTGVGDDLNKHDTTVNVLDLDVFQGGHLITFPSPHGPDVAPEPVTTD